MHAGDSLGAPYARTIRILNPNLPINDRPVSNGWTPGAPAQQGSTFSLAGRFLHVRNQVADTHTQRVCDDLESLHRHIALPPFDLSHVRSIKPAALCKNILGPALFRSECSNLGPDLLLNVLHQKQSGGTLALTIPVITGDTVTEIAVK
jgi:hypothetical protein